MRERRDVPGILLVYTGYLARGGGVVEYVKQLRRALERYGFGVHVLTLEGIPFPVRHLPHIVQYSLDGVLPPLGRYYRLKVCQHLFYPHIQRILQRHQIKGVVFQDVYSAMRLPVPAMAMLHALASDNLKTHRVAEKRVAWLKRREARLVAECPVAVATVSDAYRTSLLADLQRHTVLSRPIDAIPLGMDVSSFAAPALARSARPLHLGFSGSLIAGKNPLFLMDVLRCLRDGGIDADLTVIGDGPLMGDLKRAVADASLHHSVHCLGRIAHERVPGVLQKLHVFLLPSLQETFSYALLEAKLAGVRTIVPIDLSVPDEFCDWRIPLDAGLWAAKLRELATECERGGGWQPAPSTALREKYSADANCRRVLEVLGLWPAVP